MDYNKDEKVIKTATEHAEWFSKEIKKAYINAFIHGYKHGREDERKCLK